MKILKTSLASYFLYFYVKRDLCWPPLHLLIVTIGSHRRLLEWPENILCDIPFFCEPLSHKKKWLCRTDTKKHIEIFSITIFDTFIIHPKMLFISNVIAFKYFMTIQKKRERKKYVKYFISSKIVSVVIYLSDHDGSFTCECVHSRRRKKIYTHTHQSIHHGITYQMHTYASSVFRFYFPIVAFAVRLRCLKNVPFTHATCLFVDYRHDNDMP